MVRDGYKVRTVLQDRVYFETFLCDGEAGCRGKVCWDTEPYICVSWLQYTLLFHLYGCYCEGVIAPRLFYDLAASIAVN